MDFCLLTVPKMPLQADKLAIILPTPALLSKEYGERIDTFAEVCRFNVFRIADYKKFVGTKTTIWGVCDLILKNRNLLMGVKILNTTSEFGEERRKNGFTATVCFEMPDEWKEELTDRCEGNPTSGMIAIEMCLNSNITPHLFGFQPEHETVNYGYYWDVNNKVHWEKHNIKKEKELINQYVEDGLVVLER